MGKIKVSKRSEFFIAIAKTQKKEHPFLMLGVMLLDKPELLAMLGYQHTSHQHVDAHATMFPQAATDQTERFMTTICYQAYTMTYEHYLEFLAIMNQGDVCREQDVMGYVPVEDDGEQVTFEYKSIRDFKPQCMQAEPQENPVSVTETWRVSHVYHTTAHALLEHVLHNEALSTPALFTLGMRFTTKLVDEKLTANTFYILPPPPNCFDVDVERRAQFYANYNELDYAPHNHENHLMARHAFDALKESYQHAGHQVRASWVEFLDQITMYRAAHNGVFDVQKGQKIADMFAQAFDAKTGIQEAYEHMEEAISQEMVRLSRMHAQPSKGADEDGYQPGSRRPPTVSFY